MSHIPCTGRVKSVESLVHIPALHIIDPFVGRLLDGPQELEHDVLLLARCGPQGKRNGTEEQVNLRDI